MRLINNSLSQVVMKTEMMCGTFIYLEGGRHPNGSNGYNHAPWVFVVMRLNERL